MSVFGDRITKAMKPYDCDFCGRRILVGKQYFRANCNDAKKLRIVTMHVECFEKCVEEKRYLGKPFPINGELVES